MENKTEEKLKTITKKSVWQCQTGTYDRNLMEELLQN